MVIGECPQLLRTGLGWELEAACGSAGSRELEADVCSVGLRLLGCVLSPLVGVLGPALGARNTRRGLATGSSVLVGAVGDR